MVARCNHALAYRVLGMVQQRLLVSFREFHGHESIRTVASVGQGPKMYVKYSKVGTRSKRADLEQANKWKTPALQEPDSQCGLHGDHGGSNECCPLDGDRCTTRHTQRRGPVRKVPTWIVGTHDLGKRISLHVSNSHGNYHSVICASVSGGGGGDDGGYAAGSGSNRCQNFNASQRDSVL